MITYPITLPDQPQQDDVVHHLRVVEGVSEGNGFELISLFLKLPWHKNATTECVTCGAILEMPDGNLAAHLQRYQAEHGGKDSIVRPETIHKGPIPPTLAPGNTIVTDPAKIKSLKDFVKEIEASNQSSQP